VILWFCNLLLGLIDWDTGMVKYNCGGGGLTMGIRAQVGRLVDLMALADEIHFLRIHFQDGTKERGSTARGQMYPLPPKLGHYGSRESVLAPFARLRGVRNVSIHGAVSEEYTVYLEKKMYSIF
jgi:hypothetical protein